MLYIGIDPGERWCGFAALELTSELVVRVEARTYSITAHKDYLTLAHDLIDLLPHARKAQIVVENFQVRTVGHQHFNRGDTLRFIGAMEFAAQSIDAFELFQVQPSDAGQRDSLKLYGSVIRRYSRRWPSPSHRAWKHCLSAWRVLGMHLLSKEPTFLLSIRKMKRVQICERWLPASTKMGDHIARAARWV